MRISTTPDGLELVANSTDLRVIRTMINLLKLIEIIDPEVSGLAKEMQELSDNFNADKKYENPKQK